MFQKAQKTFLSIPQGFYLAIIILYILSFLVGYWLGIANNEFATRQFEGFSGSIAPFKNLSSLILLAAIFFNNAIKSLLAILLGFFFGIFTVYFVLVNAVILGVFVSFVGNQQGYDFVAAGLLPHGITETIALIISSAYGIWLGVAFLRYLKFKEPLRPAYKKALNTYWKVIVPLLAVSAVIEVYVTPVVINMIVDK